MPEPVLIITGPPGVGKTTTASRLAADSERSVHLESDSFFSFVRSGYVEPWKPESHDQNVAVMRIVAAAAAGYSDAGYLTIVDGIVSPRWFLGPLSDSLKSAGHRVAYAVLRGPLAVCVAHAVERGPSGLTEPQVIGQLWEEFADLGPLEAHAIDVDGKETEQVAKAVTQALQAGGLDV
jgi:tRNA uridine 5-carbamoylmethylation protein Kti12